MLFESMSNSLLRGSLIVSIVSKGRGGIRAKSLLVLFPSLLYLAGLDLKLKNLRHVIVGFIPLHSRSTWHRTDDSLAEEIRCEAVR